MGKKARKTRWRALDIAGENSDSEESNTTSSAVSSRNSRSNSNGYYSKYTYSSQSTPARRRYNQYDGSTKSTRSSSTTSENKITFNEDEYTRITTPRQDVLFKKGYLNKPKSYQTQTSTGNSTISTGNSTENGTPDHQSTDLDYESQFMFPNGFVDQNGIYYVNSYEPYPLMLFNPPTYYHECSSVKSKRMSIGSLSESLSPNNEEVTSQDLSPSGGDASNSVSDYSGGPVYNMVFPGYYLNGACTPTDLANGHHIPQEPVKKLKKRRVRNSSKNIQEDSSENTDDNSCDENSEDNPHCLARSVMILPADNHPADPAPRLEAPTSELAQTGQDCPPNETQASDLQEQLKTVCENSNPSVHSLSNGCADVKTESNCEKSDFDQDQPSSDCLKPSVLKPDAEEFVPRSYLNLGPPQHIKMLPTNFMPIPLVPINDFGGQNFAPHPAFIPPGISVNFIPHHPGQKVFPPAPGFINFAPPIIHETKIEEIADKNEENEEKETQNIATPAHTPTMEDSKPTVYNKTIDIATVVSKLEAVKQQEKEASASKEESSTAILNEAKLFVGSPRFRKPPGFKRTYYNKYKGSPVHSGEASPQIKNDDSSLQLQDSPNHLKNYPVCSGTASPANQLNGESLHYRHSPVRATHISHTQRNGLNYQNSPIRQAEVIPINSVTHRNSPVRYIDAPQSVLKGNVTEKFVDNSINQSGKAPLTTSEHLSQIDDLKKIRNSPERLNRNWKPNGYQNHHQNGYASRRVLSQQNKQSTPKSTVNMAQKTYVNGDSSPPSNKVYSGTLKKAQVISASTFAQSKKHINIDNPEKTAEEAVPVKSELVTPNQWISVSSRKKKKNKNMEDADFDIDQDVLNESAQSENTSSDFESYDPSQLIDVVPPVLIEPLAEPERNNEDILAIIEQNEATEISVMCLQTPPETKIPEVSDIEKDIIVKIEEQREVEPEKPPKENVTPELSTQIEEIESKVAIVTEVMSQVNDIQEEDTFKPKKKSKKGTQKPLTKKVIITDIDLSMSVAEVKTPVKKIVAKTEEVVKIPPKAQEVIIPESEQPEKKSKKKKKNKTLKSIQNESLPEPSSTLTTSDDSYKFIRENKVLNESLETTDDDISLELEKLIQKGMYSSLQEKIKSINVEPEADGFFKNFQTVPTSGKEKTTTANGFMKTPDFNRIFQNDAKEVQVHVQKIYDTSTEATIEPKVPAKEHEVREDSKKLYPITQAVKEWMSKTREVTPEVEILKSPSTIQREFGDNCSSDDGLSDLLDFTDEDEVILFSTDDTLCQEQPDLLEYWENEVTDSKEVLKGYEKLEDGLSNHSKVCSDGKSCIKCQKDNIKQDEEEIDVYDSKYGQNDAFLKLQKEVTVKEENSARSKSLPHRTVCCSLQ